AADIVDQHVDTPERRARLRHQLVRAGEAREIDDDFDRFRLVRTQFVDRARRALLDAVGNDDPAAFLAKPARCRASDALACAGPDAALARQPPRAGGPRIELFRHVLLPDFANARAITRAHECRGGISRAASPRP